MTHSVVMTRDELLVRKNLEWLISQAKTSPYELQRTTGVPQPTIHRILTGESTDPRTKTLQPLADYFKVSVADLRDRDMSTAVRGQAPERSRAEFKDAMVVDSDDKSMVRIPKVHLKVAAGISGFEIEPERFDGSTMAVERKWVEKNSLNPQKLIWICVAGRSMEKTLFEGDWILINTAQTEPKGEKIFAINFDGEPVIKRITRDAGDWWLTSDNSDPQYYRRICRDSECKIIGEAVLKFSEAL